MLTRSRTKHPSARTAEPHPISACCRPESPGGRQYHNFFSAPLLTIMIDNHAIRVLLVEGRKRYRNGSKVEIVTGVWQHVTEILSLCHTLTTINQDSPLFWRSKHRLVFLGRLLGSDICVVDNCHADDRSKFIGVSTSDWTFSEGKQCRLAPE
jgi:hypothetical protein